MSNFDKNGLLAVRNIDIPIGDSSAIVGKVREATISEFVSVGDMIVDFLAMASEQEDQSKDDLIKVFRDIASTAPMLLAKLDLMCDLRVTEYANDSSDTQIKFSNLNADYAVSVLGELKEVNSSFLSQLVEKAIVAQETMSNSPENT